VVILFFLGKNRKFITDFFIYSQNEKKRIATKENHWVYWLHDIIPNWLSRIYIPNCIIHDLIWPNGSRMNEL
jgi:hypothetical protein